MTFKPELETINGIFDKLLIFERERPLDHVERLDAVPYIVSYLKQNSTVDTTATIKELHQRIDMLADHIALLTTQLNSLSQRR